MPELTTRIRRKLEKEYALLKARVAVAGGMRAPHRWVFGHVDDTVWLDLNTAGYRRHAILRAVLPSLPPERTQIAFIGSSGDGALNEAFRAYRFWKEVAGRNGHPIGPQSRVLDFGAGWGRMLRFFMRDVRPENLLGVDVMEAAVQLARDTNPWGRFEQVPPLPPSALPAATFDLIYLYSVFSHLSEEAHDRWLTEFARILRPRGLVVATTWPREYIERCERARLGDSAGTHSGSLHAFHGTAEWLARYDHGEFCHSPSRSGGALAGSFYGETCIPEAYVRRQWTNRFEIREFIAADYRDHWQSVIVARKP
jgi:SAM-dependent methyltransferase